MTKVEYKLLKLAFIWSIVLFVLFILATILQEYVFHIK